jgi:hypothetical protein
VEAAVLAFPDRYPTYGDCKLNVKRRQTGITDVSRSLPAMLPTPVSAQREICPWLSTLEVMAF